MYNRWSIYARVVVAFVAFAAPCAADPLPWGSPRPLNDGGIAKREPAGGLLRRPLGSFVQYRDPRDDGPRRFNPYIDGALPPLLAARDACIEDVRRYCFGVLPGGGRIVRCLLDNRERLSKPCQDAVRAVLEGPRF